MILSIDLGNSYVKTQHCTFPAALRETAEKASVVASAGDMYLQHKDKHYTISSDRMDYQREKFHDKRYYLLTHFAVGAELEELTKMKSFNRADKTIEIDLLAGLPPMHFAKQHDQMIDYLKSKYRDDTFVYNNVPYTVNYNRVYVYPQAYAAAYTIKDLNIESIPKLLIIDMGGGTNDEIVLRYGKLDKDYTDSLEHGILMAFTRIKSRIDDIYGITLDDKDIENILQSNNSLITPNVSDSVRDLMRQYLRKYLSRFRESGFDLRTAYIVFVGGTSILLKYLISELMEEMGVINYRIIEDVRANAKGYHILHKAQQCRQKNEPPRRRTEYGRANKMPKENGPKKKHKYRFSIGFDQNNPLHQTAVEILSTQEHPANFIALAINAVQSVNVNLSISFTPLEIVPDSMNRALTRKMDEDNVDYTDHQLDNIADNLNEFLDM